MPDNHAEGFAWQLRVWDRMADVYEKEIDTRFGPVVEHVLKLADLRRGETVLDLGPVLERLPFARQPRWGQAVASKPSTSVQRC